MKKFKKFLCIAIIFIFGKLICFREVSALFINTHFNLGKMIIEQSGILLSEDEKNAFLSGLVYADIGRFKFDKETNINSDSEKFVEAMKKYAKTSEEKWFVKGFEMHVLQDKQTSKFLKEIFGKKSFSYIEYIVNCGLLDNYFLRKNSCYISNKFLDKFNFKQVSSDIDMKNLSQITGIPEDEIENCINTILDKYFYIPDKYQLVMYDNLLKDTYRFLGFEISLDDINEQVANIVGACIVIATVTEKNEISKSLAYNIEVKGNELVKLCISDLNL